MIFYSLKHISAFFLCCLSVFWFYGCSYENVDDNVKNDMNYDNNKTYKERTVLEVYISKDEKISISKKVIEFCEVSDQIKNYLMSDTIVKGYVKVCPDRKVKMSTVKCVIEEVKKAGVDSLGLGSNKDGFIIISKDKQVYDKRVTIYTVNDYSLIISGDTIDLSKMEEKLNSVLDENGRNLIVFKVRKGLSYDSYKECEDIIKKIQKERGPDVIHIKEDICPYCLNSDKRSVTE